MGNAPAELAPYVERTVSRTGNGKPKGRYVDVVPLDAGGTQYELKPAGYKLVERMSREGSHLATIAGALGMSGETFRQMRKRDVAVQAAIESGRAGMGDEITNLLMKAARKGNITAMIWLDKTRQGLTETRPMEGAKTVVNQQFNISLPAPRDRDDYLRIVTGQVAEEAG